MSIKVGIRAPDGKLLNSLQAEVVGIAVLNGMVDYYQAAHVGARGQTLSGLVRKGMLAKYTFANGNRWLPTEAARDEFERVEGSGRSRADANSNPEPR